MNILILGIDGYIGWPLALSLKAAGHHVVGIDNYSRRSFISSLTPIDHYESRSKRHGIPFFGLNLATLGLEGFEYLTSIIEEQGIDTIVHLAEMPSAPWSMQSREACLETHHNNLVSTLNILFAMKEADKSIHLVKLGTMGEYGTPQCDIPEGFINIGSEKLPFPKTPGSWYHATKVHDTTNIMFACRNWGLTSTDIMQGVVFGVETDNTTAKEDITRFDYDESFGTVINRFCVQALCGTPLTVYGEGGQTRGYLPLRDSIQCLKLLIENRPPQGEYHVVNQFERTFSINELAEIVKTRCNLPVAIESVPNPRKEAEQHHYNVTSDILKRLGYRPTFKFEDEIEALLIKLEQFADRIDPERIMPTIKW